MSVFVTAGRRKKNVCWWFLCWKCAHLHHFHPPLGCSVLYILPNCAHTKATKFALSSRRLQWSYDGTAIKCEKGSFLWTHHCLYSPLLVINWDDDPPSKLKPMAKVWVCKIVHTKLIRKTCNLCTLYYHELVQIRFELQMSGEKEAPNHGHQGVQDRKVVETFSHLDARVFVSKF